MLLSFAMLLSGCVNANNSTTVESASTSTDVTAPTQEEALEEDAAPMAALEEETYQMLLSMNDTALNTLFWYYSDISEDLQIETEGTYAADDYYRKVGRFATIEEMKAATEQVFTTDFCEARFYRAFDTANDYPMYKEIDGQLYRNVQAGGMGWPWALTDRYELAFADENWRVLGVWLEAWGEYENWSYFVFQSENGIWKFNHFYDFTPTMSYANMAMPLLDSAVTAYEWNNISELEPYYLTDFYIYQFIAEPGTEMRYNSPEGYAGGDAAPPYIVPMTEALDNLATCFDGVTKDMLIDAAQKQLSMTYNEATDSLEFLITFDPGSPLLLNVEKDGDNLILQSLSIAKSGEAVRWSYLTAQEEGEHLHYLSNRVVEIPQE